MLLLNPSDKYLLWSVDYIHGVAFPPPRVSAVSALKDMADNNFPVSPHPQPFSQRGKGEKSLALWERGRGEGREFDFGHIHKVMI
ncbi:hypothetical protein CCP4SC76_1800027 [Gammaproteobacteria bacterium]